MCSPHLLAYPSQVKFCESLGSRTKYFFELATGGELFDCVKGQAYQAWCHHCHLLRPWCPQLPWHHHWGFKYTCLLPSNPSALHLLDRKENIIYRSNNVVVNICIMGMIAFTRIHKRNTSSLLSLCIAIINYALLCGYPTFSSRQPHCPLSAKCRPQNWTRFRSSPTLHSTCCHPRFTALSYFLGGFTLPLDYHRWYAIPRQFPHHLRHIRNPRPKWNSAVTSIRAVDSLATLLLLRVAWAFNYL